MRASVRSDAQNAPGALPGRTGASIQRSLKEVLAN